MELHEFVRRVLADDESGDVVTFWGLPLDELSDEQLIDAMRSYVDCERTSARLAYWTAAEPFM